MIVKVVLVGALNKEKALVGAFSGITNIRMELFEDYYQPCQYLATGELETE